MERSLRIIPKGHLILIDYLRIISICAIVPFHCVEFLFYHDHPTILYSTWFFWVAQAYARLVPYSGQTVILLSFFLIGYTQKKFKNLEKWVGLFTLAHLLIFIIFNGFENIIQSFEWDIYPFVLVSFFFLALIQRLKSLPWKTLLSLSFLALIIPVGLVESISLPPFIKMVLFGICSPKAFGAWPLFPWLALPIGGHALGWGISKHREKFKIMNRRERILWSFFFTLAAYGYMTFHFPTRYNFSISDKYYCFILRQPPHIFWSSFFFSIFALRISLITKVNEWVSNLKISQHFYLMNWNRNFALTYVVHLCLLGLGNLLKTETLLVPWIFDTYFLWMLIGSDYISKWLEKGLVQYRKFT